MLACTDTSKEEVSSSKTIRANDMRKDKCLGRSSHVMSAYIGLDVHKDWTFATVLDQTGRVVVRRKLENEHVPSFLEILMLKRYVYVIPYFIILKLLY
jgi:hypothetical protein